MSKPRFLEQLYEELQEMRHQRAGQKAVGVPTFLPPYATGGLFGTCGFEDAVLTAFVGKGPGLIDDITWYPVMTDDDRWDVLTDIVGGGENEPATDCYTCPTCSLRLCTLHTCFGQYCRSTEEMSLLKVSRQAPGASVRRLIGGIPAMPEGLAWGDGTPLTIAELLTVGMGYCLRDLVQDQSWQGNAATTAPPGYEEMNGLSILINNGLVDAQGGAACEALDSDVKEYGFCIGDPAAPDIVLYLTTVYRQIRRRAIKARMRPQNLRYKIWMREELWPCVAAAWPALYVQLATPAVTIGRVDQSMIFDLWTRIMNEQALPFDQQWIPVGFDDGIPGRYTHAGTRFWSDIYVTTMSYGATPLIYGEHLDFNRTLGEVARSPIFADFMRTGGVYQSIDGGRFLSVVDNVRACLDASVYLVPRILVKAPWLQGRVNDVCCQLLQPYPGPDYPGFVPGGHKETTPPTFYGPCDEERD